MIFCFYRFYRFYRFWPLSLLTLILPAFDFDLFTVGIWIIFWKSPLYIIVIYVFHFIVRAKYSLFILLFNAAICGWREATIRNSAWLTACTLQGELKLTFEHLKSYVSYCYLWFKISTTVKKEYTRFNILMSHY